MKLINYEPHEIWELFQKDKPYLRAHMKVIAENPEFDVVIYVTGEEQKGSIFPNIVVCMEDSEIYSELAVSEYDCEHTVQKIYDEYLSEERLIDRLIEQETAKAEEEEKDQQIEEREMELFDAVNDLLDVFLNENLQKLVGYEEADRITEDITDRLCEYLYEEHGLSCFRPMMLEDEDGEEFFEEFPYDCMIFDD